MHCTLNVKKNTIEVLVQVQHRITLHCVRFYKKVLQRSSFLLHIGKPGSLGVVRVLWLCLEIKQGSIGVLE